MNESLLDGRKIFVQPDDKQSNNGGNNNGGEPTSLHVGNLSFDCTWQNLKDLFKRYGGGIKVDNVDIPISDYNGKSKGYGIVKFFNHRDASFALQKINGIEFQGRKLFVKWDRDEENQQQRRDPPGFKKQQSQHVGNTVHVGNLDFDCTWQNLKDLFQKNGSGIKVDHADIVTNPVTNKSKGYGIVTFLSQSDAQKAIDKMDGKMFQGREIRVKWDKKKKDIGGSGDHQEEKSSKKKQQPPPPKKEKREPPPAPTLDGALNCPR